MKQRRIVWTVRLAGLVLLALTVWVFFHGHDIRKHLGTEPWLGLYPSEFVLYGLIAGTALSLRLLVFGLFTLIRVVTVFSVFLALAMIVSFLPQITHDTSPWASESVAFAEWFFVFPVTGVSLVFAAIPLFDRWVADGCPTSRFDD